MRKRTWPTVAARTRQRVTTPSLGIVRPAPPGRALSAAVQLVEQRTKRFARCRSDEPTVVAAAALEGASAAIVAAAHRSLPPRFTTQVWIQLRCVATPL